MPGNASSSALVAVLRSSRAAAGAGVVAAGFAPFAGALAPCAYGAAGAASSASNTTTKSDLIGLKKAPWKKPPLGSSIVSPSHSGPSTNNPKATAELRYSSLAPDDAGNPRPL